MIAECLTAIHTTMWTNSGAQQAAWTKPGTGERFGPRFL
jgi:hypothetical protein